MNTAWSPWLFEKMNNGEHQIIKRASRIYILFYCFVVFIYLLVAPEVLYIMGGEEYMQTVNLLPPIIVSFVFLFIYSLYVGVEVYYKKQKYIAISTMIAAVLNIGLNYLLIPIYGYEVAAYTTLIGYIVMFILHFIVVKMMKKDEVYDSIFNIIVAFFFILLMVGVIFIYKVPIARYVMVGIICITTLSIIIWLRKEILYLLKNKSFDKIKEKLMSLKKKKDHV
jgi:O-antigen/teichoic acid export membrane protein